MYSQYWLSLGWKSFPEKRGSNLIDKFYLLFGIFYFYVHAAMYNVHLFLGTLMYQ